MAEPLPSRSSSGRLTLFASTLALFLLPLSILASDPITLFDIPTHGADSWDICAGPDGALWFIEPGGSSVGRITTAGAITEFPSGPGVYAIASGPDGNIWLYAHGALIKMSTQGAILNTYPIDLPTATVLKMTAGPDGAMWFVISDAGKVGRSTLDGQMTFYDVPRTIPPGTGPMGIAVGPDGAIWYASYKGGSVGRITTAGVLTDFPIPNYLPYSITAGPDGAMWFTDGGDGVGRITTTGQISHFDTAPGGFIDSITNGPDGNLWFTELDPYQIGRLTPSGAFAYAPISVTPAPDPARGPRGIVSGPDGNLWFVMRGEDKIGRVNPAAVSGGALCTPDDHTLCLNQGRFSVTAFFATPTGPSTPAHAVGLTADSGYFWFFGPNNIEVVAKLLNACSSSHNFWFFAAGLTNVRVDITVTDEQTQEVKTYSNAAGNAFAPIQDTDAFTTCP